MKLLSFPKEGVHPKYHKEKTAGKKVERAELPKEVVIPMVQHLGAPCQPVVKVKESVTVGQAVGESDKFVSAPVHASVSGKVVAVEPRSHPSGKRVLSVVIQAEGDDQEFHSSGGVRDYRNCAPDEIRGFIHQAGIVGMGGAAFPTRVKLSPPPDKPIDTVILNGAECEPYLSSDHRIMLERPQDVVGGLRIIMKVLGVKRAFIGVEVNKRDAFNALSELVKGDPEIKMALLKVMYPQGAEKQLIRTILGREIPSGGLPMDVGALVNNVGTAVAIAEAVKYGKPLIERVMTVSGGCIREPKNLLARMGTPVKQLIDECGGLIEPPAKIVMGGPMMGITQSSTDVPVIKSTSGILFLSKREVPREEEEQCIRCGSCVRSCPMNLMPNMLADLVKNGRFQDLKKFNVMDCIECGVCSFVCPSYRCLVQWIRFGKDRARKVG